MITGKSYTQSMVIAPLKRNDSGNISRAWNSLLDAGYTKRSKYPEGVAIQSSLRYSRITPQGINFLIASSCTASEFWDTLARYVYYNYESITQERLIELFYLYISKYYDYTLEGT